jgi:hypothetical protein
MFETKIRNLTLGLLTLPMLACGAARAPGTNPEDMSHDEHMAAAEKEKQTAENHEGKYDPDALDQEPDRHLSRGGGLWGDPAFDYNSEIPGKFYNPTAYHKLMAQQHADHASQHEAAAAALVSFENESCKLIHDDVKHLCPLIGTVSKVEEIDGGARLVIKEDVDVDGVFIHAECHRAFGAKDGHPDMPNCPLYMKNVRVEKSTDGAIDIIGDDAAATAEIRRRAKTHIE